MSDAPDPAPGAEIRWLKILVSVLTIVMIGGVLAVTSLLVIRLRAPTVPLPSEIALPDGARATALTQGETWYAVVTDADEILIFDRLTGEMLQRIEVMTSP